MGHALDVRDVLGARDRDDSVDELTQRVAWAPCG